MSSIRRTGRAIATLLCAAGFLITASHAGPATGPATGKRQHKPTGIRPQVARALERGQYDAAQKFTMFKPDGTPLRARPSTGKKDSRQRGATVRGWDYRKKDKVEGKQARRPRGRLSCRGEPACVQLIAVQKACAPRTVKCGKRSCSCRPRR